MRRWARKRPAGPEDEQIGDVDELRPADRPEVQRTQELDVAW